MRFILLLAAVAAGLSLSAPARAQTDALSSFTRTANAAISGYNREHLTAVTPLACATACRASARASLRSQAWLTLS